MAAQRCPVGRLSEPGRTAYVLGLRVVQELWLAGVRDVVLAPGSRSAPLALALHAADEDGDLRLHVRVDERSAGFLALGLATGSRRPVAVVTTSGTAVGNLLPAVMEAHHTGRRLVVVSADRPDRLRGTGANQTTEQAGIFGVFAPCHDLTAATRRGGAAGRGGRRVHAGGSDPAQPPARRRAAPAGPRPRHLVDPAGGRPADRGRRAPQRSRHGGHPAACGRRAPQRSRHGWTGAGRRGPAPARSRAAHRRGRGRRRRAGRAAARRGGELAAPRRADLGRAHRPAGDPHRPAAAHDRPPRRHRAGRRRRSPDPVAPGHRPDQRRRARGARGAGAGWGRHRSGPGGDGARCRADGRGARRSCLVRRVARRRRPARRPHRPRAAAIRRRSPSPRSSGAPSSGTRRSSWARPTRCATSTSWRPRGRRTSTASSSATGVSPASTAWCRPRWVSRSVAPGASRTVAYLGDLTFLHDANGLVIGPGGAAPRPHPRRAERRRRGHLRHPRAG